MFTDPFGTSTLTKAIIGCASRIHRDIGPGVYEKVYAECMEYELKEKGLQFELERPVPLVYRGNRLKSRFYVDIVVENLVVVELKAIAEVAEIHVRQVVTQLETDRPAGRPANQFQRSEIDPGCPTNNQPDPEARRNRTDMNCPLRFSPLPPLLRL
jgi:GxxExxY protein